jgi:flagellar hook-length control protein FliK
MGPVASTVGAGAGAADRPVPAEAGAVDPAGAAAVSAAGGTAAAPAPAGLDAAAGTSAQRSPAGVEQPTVSDQIARHLTGMRTLRDGTHHTVLHLTPDHLGPVTMTVDVRSGTVQLAVVGSESAVAALREGIADLRDQLSRSGLDLGDVSMRQDSADPGRGGPDRQAQQGAPQPGTQPGPQTGAQTGAGLSGDGTPRRGDGAPAGTPRGTDDPRGGGSATPERAGTGSAGAARTGPWAGGGLDVRV